MNEETWAVFLSPVSWESYDREAAPESTQEPDAIRRSIVGASPISFIRLRSHREDLAPSPANARDEAFNIITQFFMQERVEKARDLLVSSPLPIAEIAMACGFADQSHFTRAFSRVVGTTPGCRQRHQR
ncbi:helix-turn-helix transcriptional regulator [Ensifer adhaerens]